MLPSSAGPTLSAAALWDHSSIQCPGLPDTQLPESCCVAFRSEKLADHRTLMIAYVLGGVVLASTPVFYLVLFPGVKLRVRVGLVLRSVGMAAACLLGGAATGFLDGPAFLAGSLLVGAVAAGLVSKDRMWTLIFTLAAMGASGTLLWWKHDEAHTRSLDFNQVGVFFAAALVVFVGSLIPMRRYLRSEYIIVLGI